jgi:DNA-binding NtrC family response regulator
MTVPMIVVVTHLTEVQQAFASALGPCGLAPILASTVQEALSILGNHPISLVFCSDELPGDGPDVLIRQSLLRTRNPVPIVVVSRIHDWERHLEFLQDGAFDHVLYPLIPDEIERLVRTMRNFRTIPIVLELDSAENVQAYSQLHQN